MLTHTKFKTINELEQFVNGDNDVLRVVNVLKNVTDGRWYLIYYNQ